MKGKRGKSGNVPPVHLFHSCDRYGNLLTKREPSSALTSFDVDSATNRVTARRWDYHSTHYNQPILHDAAGNRGRKPISLYVPPISHDAAGNLYSDNTNVYSFNASGRLAYVNGGNTGSYRYDALGRRVRKAWSYNGLNGPESGNVLYVSGTDGQILAEYKNETTIPRGNEILMTDNVVMGGRIIARRMAGTNIGGTINRAEWLRRNHLNEVIMTDLKYLNSGTIVTSIGTYTHPFSSGGSDQFAGQKDDPESKLKDFGARHLSTFLARWTSPDSILGRTYDPLSLNKYTYVRNDSVNLVDKTGNRWECNNEGDCAWVDAPDHNTLDPISRPRPVNPDPPENPPPKHPDPCINKKAVAFYKEHLSDAKTLAQSLNVSVTFVLAVSADESAFGTSPIAKNANNFFGIWAGGANALPEPYKTSGGTLVSKYDAAKGYLFPGMDFVASEQLNPKAYGAKDAANFFKAIYDKFGVGLTENAYVDKMTNIESMVAYRLNCP